MKFTREGFLTAVLVVIALFVGSFIVRWLPQSDAALTGQPFLIEAEIGQTATLRTAEVTVTGIQVVKEVELFNQIAGSGAGVWLVADIVWSPVHQPSALSGNALVLRAADGRQFTGLQTITTRCGPSQPGLPVACQLALEVASDALEGAHLLIPAAGYTEASDDVADVDLGIDAAQAAELVKTDARLELAETRSVAR